MTDARELILRAVNAGAASVPEIRRATGLGYNVLYPLLERLTPWELARKVTADGWDRFYVPAKDPDADMVKEPYCVRCRQRCYWAQALNHNPGKVIYGKWRCGKCSATFLPSGKPKKRVAVNSGRPPIVRPPCPKCGGKKEAQATTCRKCFLATVVKPTVSPNGRQKEQSQMARIETDEHQEAKKHIEEIVARGTHPKHVDLGEEEERALAAMRDENETIAPVNETIAESDETISVIPETISTAANEAYEQLRSATLVIAEVETITARARRSR